MTEGSTQEGGEMAQKVAAEAVPDPGRPIYLEEARVRTEAAFGAEIDLPSGWSGSGPIISASRPTRSGACRAPMSARRSGLTCLAASPIWCWRPRAIRRCCSISTRPFRWGEFDRRHQPHPCLNENLAREILELHTLGVRSGYTRTTSSVFANVLTGWTLVPPGDNPEHGGEFTFNPRLHEPGAQKVLGKSYDDETVEQGRAVLRDLAPIRRPRRMWPASWRAISSPIRRHPRW